MGIPDAVVLVPGFLGFSRFGDFYYFADRVTAALRGSLEFELRRAVPVIPASSLPAATLVARQRALVALLAELDEKLGGIDRLHLVGHSAGGVDAHLLTCQLPLSGGVWSAAEQRVCKKVSSVCAIASPYRGTNISNSNVAKFMLNPVRHGEVLPSLAKIAWDLTRLTHHGSITADALAGAAGARPEALKFMCQFVQHRELIDDLAPQKLEALTVENPPARQVLRKSFVTVVPREIMSESDPFFRDLYELTSGAEGGPASSTVARTAAVLTDRSPQAIRSGTPGPIAFDTSVSDGVVNSARQLFDPEDPNELGAIVVADHGDVLGHYDRRDAMIAGRALNAGVFHSGAGFGDDQFFELYRRVAAVIVSAASGSAAG